MLDLLALAISSENGPILYDEPNRTSAYDDIRSIVIYIFIFSIFLSFFLILPGIRYRKIPTFICLGTSLAVSSIILISLFGTTWHVGQAKSISAAYKAFSSDRIQGDLKVNIGLQSVNITLIAHKYYISYDVDINYNERFYWIEPQQMRQEHHSALERGLPYPILTVVEYLSHDEAGFSWSRQYRAAGYYSNILLWLAISVSILMFFLHCTAPKYGIYTMQLLGLLLLFTNLTYAYLVPKGERKLVIPFEGQSLSFEFGSNYWLLFIGGALSLFVGTLINTIDLLFPNYIFYTTILDHDFDSRHRYYRHRPRRKSLANQASGQQRPVKPAFYTSTQSGAQSSLSSSSAKSLKGPAESSASGTSQRSVLNERQNISPDETNHRSASLLAGGGPRNSENEQQRQPRSLAVGQSSDLSETGRDLAFERRPKRPSGGWGPDGRGENEHGNEGEEKRVKSPGGGSPRSNVKSMVEQATKSAGAGAGRQARQAAEWPANHSSHL